MRVTTVNVNGIRSAASKGFFEWMRRHDADVVCLQEIRAQEQQLPAEAAVPGYEAHLYPSLRPGYSGVALYSKRPPDRVVRGFGWIDFDAEARYLQADFGPLSIASIYVPSGSSSEARQAAKFDFLGRLARYLRRLKRERGRQYILCGDWNIAHKPIDLKNWRSNQKNSGFLPEERAWLDVLFGRSGWLDAFRAVNQEPEQYTWWSNRGASRDRNVGWRIDYHVVSKSLRKQVRGASIYKEQRFSDHAPLTIDYDWDF